MPERRKPINKLVKIAKEHLDISKEHRDIAMKTVESNKLNLRLQGAILGVSIIGVVISYFIWQGIIAIPFLQADTKSNYDISVSIKPDFIILNDEMTGNYDFTFENTGLKNITKFQVSYITFYRELDNQERDIYNSWTDFSKYTLNCPGYDSILQPGKKCTLKIPFNCYKLCDDKDKTVGFLVYFKTTPAVANKFAELKIK